mmetsp:Transcript_129137/g.325846  ORF Transcript_129137/g.325846 Transcript_129137/m.325846 type:complete len:408 (+) Transcript_129137:216-1439(+)
MRGPIRFGTRVRVLAPDGSAFGAHNPRKGAASTARARGMSPALVGGAHGGDEVFQMLDSRPARLPLSPQEIRHLLVHVEQADVVQQLKRPRLTVCGAVLVGRTHDLVAYIFRVHGLLQLLPRRVTTAVRKACPWDVLQDLDQLLPQLHDVELDEDNESMCLTTLHHVKLVHELLVIHASGTVRVQHMEDYLQISLYDVHRLHDVGKGGVAPETVHNLFEREGSAAVRIEILADTEQVLTGADPCFLLIDGLLLDSHLSGLCSLLDDHGQDQIHDGHGDGDEDEEEEEGRSGVVLDDGHRGQAPTVPSDDMLRERQHGLLHRRESVGAALAPRGLPVPGLGNLPVEGVDDHHGEDAPHAETHEDHEDRPDDRLDGVQQAPQHQSQLWEQDHQAHGPQDLHHACKPEDF